MDGKNEFREGLFPSGFCIAPEDGADTEVNGQTAHQLFNEIDHGQVDERALVLAKQVCQSCAQLPFCETQTDELATELWRRGAGMSIVGGTSVKVAAGERQLRQERPKFTFNLTRIPSEPEAAVTIIRQAFRAGQLNAAGPTPKGVKAASAAYLERLTETDPELREKLAEIGEDETTRGLKFILTALFQQKDFESFSRGEERQSRAGNLRYSPDIIDTTTDDPIVSHFLKDTIAIRELGFSKAAGKAAHFEPEYYAQLAATHKPASMSWSDFDRLIGTNRNPLEAIVREQERTSAVRSLDSTASRTTVKATLRHGNKDLLSETDIAELEAKYSGYDFVTPQLIKSILNSNVGNPSVALEDVVQRVVTLQERYPADHPHVRVSDLILFSRNHNSRQKAAEAVDTFAKTMERLTEKYGDDPDVTPSDIRRFSTSYPTGAEQEVRNYKNRLEHLRCASDSRITDSIIRQCARRGITSPIEVAKIYDRRLIHDRFSYRAKKEVEAEALKPELVERIVCLYPTAEINQVSEQVYQLINSGILAFNRAEAYSLQGELHEDLDKIFSPKSQEYLTFSADFRAWTPVQRLAFAHYHHLVPLMYGREANTLQLERLALSGNTLGDYYQEQLAPLLDARATQSGDTRTLDLLEINIDLSTFDTILQQAPSRPLPRDDERLTLSGLRDTSLVVGGKALYLRDPEYSWDWMEQTPDFAGWLYEKISGSYPPHQQEQAHRYITEAIDSGVLELLGEDPGEYRLVFTNAFYESTVTDLERAAIANAMGIDVLLYGSDLSIALSHRIGNTPLQSYVHRIETPEISEFTDEQLSEAKEQLAQEALNIDAQPPLTQLLLTSFGDGFDFEKLTSKQRQTVADDLLEAYNRHIEHPNHQHEVYDETVKAQVTLAWTDVRGGDVHAMARLFSVVGDDYDTFIEQGLSYIREQFASIPASRLVKTAKILDRIKAPVAQEQTTTTPLPFVAPLHTYVDLDAEYATDAEVSRPEAATLSPKATEWETPSAEIPADKPSPIRLEADEWVIIPTQQTEDSTLDDETTSAHESGISDSILQQYIAIAQQYPSLSMEEEHACAAAIQAGIAAKNALDEGAVEAHERAAYEQRVIDGEAAKMHLIHCNLQIVVRAAFKYPERPAISTVDYIQEGNIGLLEAAERFKPEAQVPFSAYATFYVKKHMGLARDNLSHAASVEGFAARNASRYRLFSFNFRGEHGRAPTQEETLQKFGWSVKQYEKAMQINIAPTSLNKPVKSNYGSVELGDLIPTEKNERSVVRSALSHIVRTTLNGSDLQRKQALALTLLSGLELHPDIIDEAIVAEHNLEEGRSYTPKEIASFLGFTHQSVSRYRRQAIKTLSHTTVKDRLAYLLDESDVPYPR